MDPTHTAKRRRRDVQLAAEDLESRNLMTAGAGNTFAIVPGTVATAGGTTAIKFTIDPAHFTMPKGKITLGIDVVAQSGTTAKPVIKAVLGPDGRPVPQTFHARYDPRLVQTRPTAGPNASAVITPLKVNAKNPKAPQTFTVVINDKGTTGGSVLVGFYLPGDTKGTGKVDAAALKAVQKSLGAKANTPNYSFDADANRDGRITATDLKYAKDNLGVTTNVSPVVSANLDPATVTSVQDRVTRTSSVRFDGVATPGAMIKFEQTAGKVPLAAIYADSAGNYNLNVPLAPGSNTFKVTTQDAFGQSITGTIAPVTYITTPAVTAANVSTVAVATPTTSVKVTKA